MLDFVKKKSSQGQASNFFREQEYNQNKSKNDLNHCLPFPPVFKLHIQKPTIPATWAKCE